MWAERGILRDGVVPVYCFGVLACLGSVVFTSEVRSQASSWTGVSICGRAGRTIISGDVILIKRKTYHSFEHCRQDPSVDIVIFHNQHYHQLVPPRLHL